MSFISNNSLHKAFFLGMFIHPWVDVWWWVFLLLDVNCPTQKNRELAGHSPQKVFISWPAGWGWGRRLRTRLFWRPGQCSSSSSSQASISRLSCSSHRNISALARTHALRDRTTACQSVSLASPIGNNRLAADFWFSYIIFLVRLFPFACMTVRRGSCKNVPCDSVLFRSFHSVAVVVGFFIGFKFGVGFFCQWPWRPEGTCVCVLRRSGFTVLV